MQQPQAVPLPPKSEEHIRIKYLLQLSLGSKNVEDVRVWKVDNPHLAVQFEKRTSNMLCLDSWVDATALTEQNSVQNVFSRGFKFPSSGEGMKFTNGKIQLKATNGGAHQFLYCHMGVGRSYVMDDSTAKKIIPPGYDSIYTPQEALDRDGDGKFSMDEYEAAATHDQRPASEYSHDYLLLDSTQSVARYLVEFFFTDDGVAGGLTGSSGGEDDMYDRYDFFDPILYMPVSFRDKMVGSHSSGENAGHKLIGINDAYETAKAASMKEDPILASRARDIRGRLTAVDAKLRAVNKNSAHVEETIYQMLQEALFQLQDETQRKMNKLLGEELELRRQLEQIGWVEDFLGRQRAAATPVEFLEAWKNHLQLRDEMHELGMEHQSIIDLVQPDIRVVGSVQVSVDGGNAGAFPPQAPMANGAGARGGYPQPSFTPMSAAAPPPQAPMAIPGMPMQAMTQAQTMSPQASMMGGMGGGMMQSPPPAPSSMAAASPAQPSPAQPQAQPFGTSTIKASPAGGPGSPLVTSAVASALPPNPPGGVYTPDQLRPVVDRFGQYSLRTQAERKMRQLEGQVKVDPAAYFAGSAILTAADSASLFFCLPFTKHVPQLDLVYSSSQHGRHASTLLQYCNDMMAPSVVLVKSGSFVFGGYASESWQVPEREGERFGTPKCFLFSVTHDRKIPFHGRQRDRYSQTRPALDEEGYPRPLQHDCLSVPPTADSIAFGVTDLVLAGDFSQCSSELEFSYGMGLAPGSQEAKCFLAGSAVFRADEVEVWRQT